MDEAEKVLKNKYEEYKEKPKTYTRYTEEWKLFWTKRYKELRAGNMLILYVKNFFTDFRKII